jgi:hypothetical protein
MNKGSDMPNYLRHIGQLESRERSRERWREVFTKTHVTKWLLLSIACAVLLTAIALWWWEQEPMWWFPVAEAAFMWLYLAGAIALLKIRGWRSYVSTVMYMEALEDGLCNDRLFTWEECNRWYREHGSPWGLQALSECMRVHEGVEDCPNL